ncbi:MAG: phosphoenolpyruvate carboxykinase (ATP), partial [Terracidiphilus sp.]
MANFSLEETLGALASGPQVYANTQVVELIESAIKRGEARLASNGALVATTAPRTGRSPKDKFTVDDATTHTLVHWGKVNQPFAPERFEALLERVLEYLRSRELFVQDLYSGADPAYRLPIRVISEYAWHALFVRQLFVRPEAAELAAHAPEFTVIAAPEFEAVPERDGTRSGAFILADFTRKIILIGGTKYAGEIKKSI